jgi:TRAP transporter T-component
MLARPLPRLLAILLLAVFSCSLSSCARLLTGTVIKPAVGNLQQQEDIALVCEGAPAYLLMLDSMLVSSPESEDLLLIAAQSYSAYATALEECGGGEERIKTMNEKARTYGKELLRSLLPIDTPEDHRFTERLAQLRAADVPAAFWGTSAWLGWVLRQKGAPQAVADIVVIEKIMARILELDEAYQGGAAHLFFGALHAAKPVQFGGRPDLSAHHFEKALELSGGRFLLVQTTYAATLARTTMDQELHDRLLKEVLAFPLASAREFGLSNRIAVNRAKRLLAENYFD